MVGRVEICIDNVWGTICNDNWDDNDAQVVCRQKGFSDVGQYRIVNLCVNNKFCILG